MHEMKCPGRAWAASDEADSAWSTISASKPEDWTFHDDGLAVCGRTGHIKIQMILGGDDVHEWWTASFTESYRFGHMLFCGDEPIEYIPMVMLDGGKAAIPEPVATSAIAERHLFVATLLSTHDRGAPRDYVRRAGLRVAP